jgi:hypothetical protein
VVWIVGVVTVSPADSILDRGLRDATTRPLRAGVSVVSALVCRRDRYGTDHATASKSPTTGNATDCATECERTTTADATGSRQPPPIVGQSEAAGFEPASECRPHAIGLDLALGFIHIQPSHDLRDGELVGGDRLGDPVGQDDRVRS